MKKCPNCGRNCRDTERICSNCGYSLAQYGQTDVETERIYPSKRTLYDRDRPRKSPPQGVIFLFAVLIIIVVSLIVLVSSGIISVNLPGNNTGKITPGVTPTSPQGSTAVPSRNIVHYWTPRAVQAGEVQGPGIISGDFDVNGITVHQGLNYQGTVIVLADNTTYTLSAGLTGGTIYAPVGWQPTSDDLKAKAQLVVNDQHIHGCQGGCLNSYVATFRNGQETSAGVQNPT
jgi:hypothetical protein